MGMLDASPPNMIVETEASVTSDANSFRLSTESPLLFVDGHLFACEYDGDACSPIFGISLSDFVAVVQQDLMSTSKSETMFMSPALTSRIRSNTYTSSPSPSPSRSRRRAGSMMHRDSHPSPAVHSEAEDFLGVSYENLDHQPRSSFLVPIVRSETCTREPLENLRSTEDDVKKREFELLTGWIERTCHDYVSAERIASCHDLALLLEALLTRANAVLVFIKVQSSDNIIVTYQFLPNFKQKYMLVRIDKNFCMLMRAF